MARAEVREQQAVGRPERGRQVDGLGAHVAAAGGMIRVPLHSRDASVVHAHEEAVFWCRWLKPLFRFQLVYDMHSSLPEQLDNFHFVRLPLLRRLFARWERIALRRADAVITVCPALLSAAIAAGADSGRTLLIENSLVDPIEVQIDDATRQAGAARAEKARRWVEGRGGANTIIYAGTLEAYQGIDRLLEGFA